MSSSSSNQFSIDGMRKLSSISIYTSVLIVEVIIAIFFGLFNDMQFHIMTDLKNLFVFFGQSSLNVSFERNQTKVPVLSLWPMQILDSSLNITFIWSQDVFLLPILISFSSVACWCWFLFWLFSMCIFH